MAGQEFNGHAAAWALIGHLRNVTSIAGCGLAGFNRTSWCDLLFGCKPGGNEAGLMTSLPVARGRARAVGSEDAFLVPQSFDFFCHHPDQRSD